MSRIECAPQSQGQTELRRQLRPLPSIVHHALGTLYEEPALLMLVISVSGLTGLQHLLPQAVPITQASGKSRASPSRLASLGSGPFMAREGAGGGRAFRDSLQEFGDDPASGAEPELRRRTAFISAVQRDVQAPLLEVRCAAVMCCTCRSRWHALSIATCLTAVSHIGATLLPLLGSALLRQGRACRGSSAVYHMVHLVVPGPASCITSV
jgi:hypothetical protein